MATLDRISCWLSTLLGIHLAQEDPWQVTSAPDVSRFLRALPLLAPACAIAYFERTTARHVAEYLRTIAVPPPVHVAASVLWPRPDRYHVPITVESMHALASFLDKEPFPGRLCRHCHVYAGHSMLLEWHDAFGTKPIRISRSICKETVTRFAAAVGSSVVPDDRC